MPLKPFLDNAARQTSAKNRRATAANMSATRRPVETHNNGEIFAYKTTPTNYYKGLPHNQYGIVESEAFKDFISALNREGLKDGATAKFDVALGPSNATKKWPGKSRGSANTVTTFFSVLAGAAVLEVRSWESPHGERLVIAGDGKGGGTVYLVKGGAKHPVDDWWWGKHVPTPAATTPST